MPIYEYKCIKCGKVYQQLYNSGEMEQEIVCECGSECKKIMSVTGKPIVN
jgi:putative FmdB family regulatory protein